MTGALNHPGVFLGTGRMGGPMAANLAGAGLLITMLADGPATEQLLSGPDGFGAAGPGIIWVQMGTVGQQWTARLAGAAAAHGMVFADAPVSGSEGPARAGQLTILASGPDRLRDVLAPVFGALGRATVWLGPAGDFTPAFALKHALKDAELAAQAAQASGASLALTDALLPRWRHAAASGHADEDVAAIYTTP